jgi:predicted negative regulator of RcsB-dependent stress response
VAKPDSTQATETLHEIESIFDRLAHWTAHNPVPVLAGLAAILLSAAAFGGYQAWRASQESAASAEVAAIEAEYQSAMGAKPGELEIPEPANAEAATATRREYATRLGEAADRLGGTRAAVAARLRAGQLHAEAGDSGAALDAWRAAVEAAPRGSALVALARMRLAAGLESAGDAAAAAEAYLAAGGVADFPGRVLALGDAARCFADSGQTARALEVFGGLSPEEVEELPAYVAARLGELRIREREAGPAAAPAAP